MAQIAKDKHHMLNVKTQKHEESIIEQPISWE